MNKELLQQALECFEEIILHNDQHVSTANKGVELLCAAIAQPEQTADATHAAPHYLAVERSQGIPALDAGPAAVLYSDSINGCMVRRDDVWLALTSHLAQPEQTEGDAKDAAKENKIGTIGHTALAGFGPMTDAAIASQKGAV